MVQYTTIQEYINYLIENQINISVIDFVKEINKLKYNIDISFIDEFIELVSKDDCCIHHNMLEKYGILTLKKGSTDIKRILEQNEFEENDDFKLRNVAEFKNSNGGRGNKNEYFLHPRSFKICLMRSLKTRKYAKYYLLLEECIKYFNDYQIELNKKYIIKLKEKNKENKIVIKEKDDKIDKLEKLMIKANIKLDKVLDKLDETTNMLEDSKEELELTNEKLDNTDKTLIQVAKKLDIAVEDRVIKTKKSTTLEYFIIMKNNTMEYKYYIIRGQKRYINKKKEQLEGFTQIKILECVPNAAILWNLMKEKIKNKIDCCGNKLNLININESEFLSKVNEIYNNRKEVNL
uniref:DUF3627 domain-containing protein n=1 Tax=viral metagenome TaxID=1070528 RepID=A0A6C0EE58_9ZZZZ